MYAEYAGLTQEAVTLIESLRKAPSESKSEILVRVLSPLVAALPSAGSVAMSQAWFDLGQGAHLVIGEKIFLYLSKAAKKLGQPDAEADVRSDGLYLDGRKVRAVRGNPLQTAMKIVQEKKGHRNDAGEIISLSAWRQWHVIRDGRIVPVFELKDPVLAFTRGRRLSFTSDKSAAELGV